MRGCVERKDDNDWVKRCITWEVEGIRRRGRQKNSWWDCVKNDMESLGLSQQDAQSRNKWRRRRGQPANPGSPGKMAVKTRVYARTRVCVFLSTCLSLEYNLCVCVCLSLCLCLCVCACVCVCVLALWFHNVVNVDGGVAVNVFWRQLSADQYDRTDTYGNKDLLPAARAGQAVDRAIKLLDALPDDYRDFYARKLIARIQSRACKHTHS